MNKKLRGGWTWPILTLMAGILWIILAVAVQRQDSPRAKTEREIHGQVYGILNRERAFFASNFAFTSKMSELDLAKTRAKPWTLELSTGQIDGRPFLLIEANDGEFQYCLDQDAKLSRSSIEAFPSISVWRPAPAPRIN